MNRFDRRRIRNDDRLDRLLVTPEGFAAYRAEIVRRCSESSLCALLEEALERPGDIIECGVYRGKTTRLMAELLARSGSGKVLFAADSFEGFPGDGVGQNDTSRFRWRWLLLLKFRGATDVPLRLNNLFAAMKIDGRILRGFFESTLPGAGIGELCFIHLDSDTYSSHKFCLELLYDRLVPGGIIVFDDYRQPKWPGATKAIDEFFARRTEKPELCRDRTLPAWFVRKADPVARGGG